MVLAWVGYTKSARAASSDVVKLGRREVTWPDAVDRRGKGEVFLSLGLGSPPTEQLAIHPREGSFR